MKWLPLARLLGRADKSEGEADDPDLDTDAMRRPKMPLILRRIAPYIGAIGALALVAMVLLTMYFTWLDWQWVTFLSGILGAAILSLASRSIHAEWTIARRTAQLSLARQRLAVETRGRIRAEQALAGIEKNTTYLHDTLPAMLAYIDDRRQLTFHNRAFRHGLGAAVNQIDGRHLREVVGNVVYDEMESDISEAFEGHNLHRERTHSSSAGETFRLLAQYLPDFSDGGEAVGVFLLWTDITDPIDLALHTDCLPAVGLAGDERSPATTTNSNPSATADDDNDAARLRDALARDEFCLFFQAIEPVAAEENAIPLREILLRLKVEEEGMLPPGSFLPVAEQYGMLPDLDRWVVCQLLRLIQADALRQQAIYSINISSQTMADLQFPAFVAAALRDFDVPGSLLCFELQEADMQQRPVDASRFIRQLQASGCQFAICGFSGNRASFDLLRRVPVNFLKIDGSLVRNLRRSAIDYARVKAIQRVAQAIGVITIAECVEDNKTQARLRSLGVNYAQGFGIARPQALQLIFPELPCSSAIASASPPLAAAA